MPTPPRVSGTDKVVSDRGLFLIYTGREAFGFDEPPLTRLVGNLLDVEPDCIGYKSIIQNRSGEKRDVVRKIDRLFVLPVVRTNRICSTCIRKTEWSTFFFTVITSRTLKVYRS